MYSYSKKVCYIFSYSLKKYATRVHAYEFTFKENVIGVMLVACYFKFLPEIDRMYLCRLETVSSTRRLRDRRVHVYITN